MSDSRKGKDEKDKKSAEEKSELKNPPPLIRQKEPYADNIMTRASFFDVTLKKTFEFEKSSDPYDYANIMQHTGLKSVGNYFVGKKKADMYLHFDIKTKQTENPITLQDAMERMRAGFKAKKLEADATGWKLHISVAPEYIDKAWSIIRPILMAHEATGFKIIDPPTVEQAFRTGKIKEIGSKQFTIYQHRNLQFTDKQWEVLIKEIEDALQKARIRPAERTPEVDKKMEGSKYFSYRNDKDPRNKAEEVPADAIPLRLKENPALVSYNLTGEPDPFASVKPFAEKKEFR